jgi:hypothetical protein
MDDGRHEPTMVSLTEMMTYNRRNGFAAQRFAERRRREDEAPRLSEQVLDLENLRLELEERCGVTGANPKYTRRFVVARAPALFFVPCGEPRCLDGGHDFTSDVMHALRTHQTSFEATDTCAGSVGTSQCTRSLHFDAVAEYRCDPSTSSPPTVRTIAGTSP